MNTPFEYIETTINPYDMKSARVNRLKELLKIFDNEPFTNQEAEEFKDLVNEVPFVVLSTLIRSEINGK